MALTIKYDAKCTYCGRIFKKGKAYLQRVNGKWECNCFDCYKKNKEIKTTKIIARAFLKGNKDE